VAEWRDAATVAIKACGVLTACARKQGASPSSYTPRDLDGVNTSQGLLGLVCYTEAVKHGIEREIAARHLTLPVHARTEWYFS